MTTRTQPAGSPIAADLSAGLVVFLVAIPLCLGIALASNAPLFSGLLAGIIGGIVVGSLSGSHTSVSGPAAGLTAVVAAQIATIGSFEGFMVAVVIAGVLQIVLGVVRAGSIADFVPSAVIKGLLAAIGLILILKQIPHLFGWDADPIGEMSFQQPDHQNTFSELAQTYLHLHWGAAFIGALSIGLLVLWGRSKRLQALPVPSALIVVLGGIGINALLGAIGSAWTVEASHLVQVPAAESLAGFLDFLEPPDFSQAANPAVYIGGVTIALVASLETLLNLEAVDRIDPQKRTSPPNRELVAQGIGNMLAGMVGGLPVTSVIVRSSVNINAGGRTKASAIVHGLLLLSCVALVPHWLNLIPLSALAAVLIMTGLKLASPKIFRQMWAAGYEQFVPFCVTILAILFTDLLLGILIGLGFSILFILYGNLRRPLHRTMERHVGGEVLHIELGEQVSFLNRVALRNALDKTPRGGRVLLDARSSDYIDSDILAVIREFADETAPARDIEMSLVGFKPHYDQIEDDVKYVDFVTRDLQERLTPDEVVEILRAGNERFRKGEMLTRDLKDLRNHTAKHRHPLAVVLSGSSSRTPVELLFDVGLGEIFCARATGNSAMPSSLGSLEYACAVDGAKVIVVLGHTDNKAIRLAIDALFDPARAGRPTECVNLDPILEEIQESVDRERMSTWHTANDTQKDLWVDDVSRAHVIRTARRILEKSPVLARLAREGQIGLVGGLYDTRSGAVDLFDVREVKHAA